MKKISEDSYCSQISALVTEKKWRENNMKGNAEEAGDSLFSIFHEETFFSIFWSGECFLEKESYCMPKISLDQIICQTWPSKNAEDTTPLLLHILFLLISAITNRFS